MTHRRSRPQGRVDGAICEHTEEDKHEWLASLRAAGIKNIEMEGLRLASFCHKLGIPALILCTVVVDRSKGDQVVLSEAELAAVASNAQRLAIRFIKKRLGL